MSVEIGIDEKIVRVKRPEVDALTLLVNLPDIARFEIVDDDGDVP